MDLAVAVRSGSLVAPTLPMCYPALTALGLQLRRGQLSLTIAAPGVGKSQLWLNFAARMKVPTVYWSADTDAHDVLIHSLALLTGTKAGEVETNYTDPAWQEYYTDQLKGMSHVDWVFDSAIRGPVIVNRLAAYAEVRGEYPHLLVLDNLSNTVEKSENSYSEQTDFMARVQQVARTTGVHVAVLAHTKGEYENGNKPIPLSGSLNNLGKIPEVVVSLHRQDDRGRWMGLNVTKNRGGKSDPSASNPASLEVDFASATVKGFK